MINKELLLKYHEGKISVDEIEELFTKMSNEESIILADHVFNIIADKSYSSICAGKEAERRVLGYYVKYHDVRAEFNADIESGKVLFYGQQGPIIA